MIVDLKGILRGKVQVSRTFSSDFNLGGTPPYPS